MANQNKTYGVVTRCLNVWLYSKPSINSPKVGKLSRGTRVLVKAEEHEKFYRVISAAGFDGYCLKFFIDLDASERPLNEE